jgi:hypothetical protein
MVSKIYLFKNQICLAKILNKLICFRGGSCQPQAVALVMAMKHWGLGLGQRPVLKLTMSMYPTMMVAVLGCEKVVISCLSPKLLYEWNKYLLLASPLEPLPISASNLA